jgi:hypothetical protein
MILRIKLLIKSLSSVIPINDDAIRVLYKNKKHFAKENACSNIVLSLWTTSKYM